MTEVNAAPASAIVLQSPNTTVELNWAEKAHGVESVMTIIALFVGAAWAVFGDWRKTKSERESERSLRERERKQRENHLKQQRQKLEWEQTQTAREVNEKFVDDTEAQQALTLVDCDNDTCTLTDYSEKDLVKHHDYDVKGKEDVRSLRIQGAPPSEKEEFLRECFDAWFYWMAVLEQYLENGLIRQKDMAFPSDYYLRQLRNDKDLHAACLAYVTHYELSSNVLAFMKRFEDADIAKLKPPATVGA